MEERGLAGPLRTCECLASMERRRTYQKPRQQGDGQCLGRDSSLRFLGFLGKPPVLVFAHGEDGQGELQVRKKRIEKRNTGDDGFGSLWILFLPFIPTRPPSSCPSSHVHEKHRPPPPPVYQGPQPAPSTQDIKVEPQLFLSIDYFLRHDNLLLSLLAIHRSMITLTTWAWARDHAEPHHYAGVRGVVMRGGTSEGNVAVYPWAKDMVGVIMRAQRCVAIKWSFFRSQSLVLSITPLLSP